ncbi:LacI family transcriptional regulator [Leifsonia sp. ku-ls]|nr:LacI family transcriptional regulator [Leifsonia sp. ku-ls]
MAKTERGVNVFDVARAAGVSKSTAARVLAGAGSASPRAVERVRAAAASLGYTPNGLAKAMVSGETNTIGVIVPDISSAFFAAVVRGITDVARTEGFEVLLSNTDGHAEAEDRTLEVFAQKRVDGIVIAPLNRERSAALAQLEALGMPLVLLDRSSPAASGSTLVSLDHAAASGLAVEHLVKLGHERIAVLSEAGGRLDELLAPDVDRSQLPPSSLRLLGFVDAMAEHGLPLDRSAVIAAGYDREAGRAAVRERFARDDRPTALYCTSELLSSGAYEALLDLGLRYPEDVSFIGFDDQEWCTLVRPAITVVAQPHYDLGSATAHRLVAAIRGPRPDPARIALPPTLVVRHSTGPARAR